jgi:site-specific recombinase XerD
MSGDHDILASYLYYLEHDLDRAQNTSSTYRLFLVRFIDFLESKNSHILECGSNLVFEYAEIESHRKELSRASRHPLVAALKSFFKWLHFKNYRDDNPAKSLKYPKKGRKLPIPMTNENAERLMLKIPLDTLKGVRDAAIIAMFLGTGMRLGGLVGLNESSLSVIEVDGDKRFIVKSLEKGNKEHLKPLPNSVVLYLKAYLSHPDLDAIDRKLPNGDKVLFISTTNTTVSPEDYYGETRRLCERSVQRMMEVYGNKAGIPRNQCHPHALRHSFATELVEDNVDLKHVQSLLGHANLNTTAIYITVAIRKTLAIVDKSSPIAKINTPVTDLAGIMAASGL